MADDEGAGVAVTKAASVFISAADAVTQMGGSVIGSDSPLRRSTFAAKPELSHAASSGVGKPIKKEEDEKLQLKIRTSVVSKTVRKLDLEHDPEKSCEALRNEVATGLGVPDQLRCMLVLKEENAPKVLSGDTDSLIRVLDVNVRGRLDDEDETTWTTTTWCDFD